MINEKQKAFVCGWPIEHSKSPLIHNHWLQKYGISGSYEKVAVSPDNFPDFLSSLRDNGFAGGNVTLPHKEAALELVMRLEASASKIGAVNTLWFEDNVLVGGNTDWIGFSANLDQNAPGWNSDGRTALVIGAGGAARGVLYALLQNGLEKILLANRTFSKAEKLAVEFGTIVEPVILEDVSSYLPATDLLVNTSSMGMQGAPEFPTPVLQSMSRLKPGALVTDIVYTPLETPLLNAAKEQGFRTVDGLGMLLHQAVPGFEKWFGIKPVVTDELRNIILSAG